MFKGDYFDGSVILLCVRWYLAYSLSLRDLEAMMAERGIPVDHTTIHRWTIHYAPLLMERFNRRKRPVSGRWHVDETYIKVRGQWRYLYRATDSNGDTVDLWFSERRNLTAAKRFLRKALKRHGRPERIVIDGSQTNREAILSGTTDRLQNKSRRDPIPIRMRESAYLNNRIEQDHHAISGGYGRCLVSTQLAGSRDPGRHRDDLYDAEGTGEVCLQSAHNDCRAVRTDRCLRLLLSNCSFRVSSPSLQHNLFPWLGGRYQSLKLVIWPCRSRKKVRQWNPAVVPDGYIEPMPVHFREGQFMKIPFPVATTS
jgi:putative transposase